MTTRAEQRRRFFWAGITLVLSLLGAAVLLLTSPPVDPRPRSDVLRTVRVLEVVPETVQWTVRSQGTVVPRVESELVPEISGRVVWVAPALAAGGFFESGAPLVRLDAADYQSQIRRARARVIRGEAELGHAQHQLTRRENLATRQVLSEEQLEDARRTERVAYAELEEARVELAEAERNLARTELRARFVGRVRQKTVDVGQFVERGRSIATLYAIDHAEVRLPVPDRELSYLDWPSPTGEVPPGTGPEVTLSADFGGALQHWKGRIVRAEGAIDPRTRMVHVVARVEDPYGRATTAPADAVPLAVGLFVQARIYGRTEKGAVVLPRRALREGNRVRIVDGENRLWERPVEVLRIEGERAYLRAEGLAGARVCVSDVPLYAEGMAVEVAQAAAGEPGG